MAQLTRARSSELATGLRDLESVFSSSIDAPILATRVLMPGDDKHSSVAFHNRKAGNSIEHLLNKISTVQQKERTGKAVFGTDTDKVEINSRKKNLMITKFGCRMRWRWSNKA